MKKNKIFALIIAAAFMMLTFIPAASALDMNDVKSFGGLLGVDDSALGGIADLFSGQGGSLSLSDLFNGGSLSKVRDLLGSAASGVSNEDLMGAIASLFGGNLTTDLLDPDILDKLADYLAGETYETTTAPVSTQPQEIITTAPTTEAPTTEPTTQKTEEPATQGSSSYTQSSGYTQAYIPASYTTAPEYDSSTYQEYVTPESTTVQELVPTSNRIIEDDDYDSDGGVSVKMIVGIGILVLSAAGVATVAVIVKKNRI